MTKAEEIKKRAELASLERRVRELRAELGIETFAVTDWGQSLTKIVHAENESEAYKLAGSVGIIRRAAEVEPDRPSGVRRRDSVAPGENHWTRAAQIAAEGLKPVLEQSSFARVVGKAAGGGK